MLLLVEDDEMLGSATAEGLAHAFKVTWVRNVTDAKFALEEVAFDIVLLDLGLPDGSGLGLLRDMRANRHLEPVIILTALDSPAQRIAGLKAGADDYVGKPFDLGELAARCEALIRRARGHAQSAIDFDGLVYDKAEHRLTQDGQEVVLSATELRIFDLLMAHAGSIVSKSQIEDRLYHWTDGVESNTIEVYVSRLRRKLGRDRIRTVRGLGYMLGRRA